MEQDYIFISYSRADERAVNKIVALLKNKGFTVWIDKTGIETGEQFKNVIVEAISNCKVFIFISSKASNSSEWTEKEIGVAVSLHKIIIPIKLDKTQYNKSVLLDLVNLNYINYGDIKHRKEQMEHLVETITSNNVTSISNVEKLRTLSKLHSLTISFARARQETVNYFKIHWRLFTLVLLLILVVGVGCLRFVKNHTYSKRYVIPQQYGELRDIAGKTIAKLDIGLYDISIDPQIAINYKYGYDIIEDQERKVYELCKKLSVYTHGQLSSNKVFARIKYCSQNGGRYLNLLRNIEKGEYDSIKEWPIWERLHYAIIIKEVPTVYYPFGVLASRTIGTNKVGIIGKYGAEIEGKPGGKEVKITNIRNRKYVRECSYTPPEDGHIVNSTLDMDLQEIADKALRSNIIGEPEITGAALILMDVNTGAILSMVNLCRSRRDLSLRESYNYAIGRRFEPGTLWGGVSLATYCPDNTDLNSTPENQWIWWNPGMPDIDIRHYNTHNSHLYIPTLKRIYATNKHLSFREGIAKANSYSMSSLVMRAHQGQLNEYIDNITALHICDSLPLEIEGVRKTHIGLPRYSEDYNAYLATLGGGYGIEVTALQLHTFYNSIVKGSLVYPYLIESVSTISGGILYAHQVEEINYFKEIAGEETLSIADTVKSVMKYAAQKVPTLKATKYKMGALYGESLSVGWHDPTDDNYDNYIDSNGQSIRQAGCFGYFPCGEPKYSAFCIIFTDSTNKVYLGEDIPCKIMGDLADGIYEKENLYNNKYLHR